MAGGTVYPLDVIREIGEGAREREFEVHMDGARVFNAAEYLGEPVRDVVAEVDTVIVLPVEGAGRAGGLDARRNATSTCAAGGCTASGWAAGCGRPACWRRPGSSRSKSIRRKLAADHANAALPGDGAGEDTGHCGRSQQRFRPNIVIFDVSGAGLPAAEFSARLKTKGVLMNAVSETSLRAVTHYDVNRESAELAVGAISEVASTGARMQAV